MARATADLGKTKSLLLLKVKAALVAEWALEQL